MAIDIASMDATQKLAFASAVGSVKLAGATFNAPVSFFDLAFPAGYKMFKLEMWNWMFNSLNAPAGAFSFDGGSTFLNDTTNFDSYAGFGANWRSLTLGSTYGSDALIQFAGDFNPPSGLVGGIFSADIYPGSANDPAALKSNSGALFSAGHVSLIFYTVNLAATVAPTLARANMLRISPYGNGDIAPPTSGDTFTSGSYALYGVA